MAAPPAIAHRLIDDNPHEPLWPSFRRFGPGKPGVTQESRRVWVIRTDDGCVAGGANVAVDLARGMPVSIDVAIDPRYRQEGYATRLYAALEAAGIDVESGSDASLRFGTMTKDGYAFMVGRRSKKGTSRR